MTGFRWKVKVNANVDVRPGAQGKGPGQMHQQPDTDPSNPNQVNPGELAKMFKGAMDRGVTLDLSAMANGPSGAILRKWAYFTKKQVQALNFVERMRDRAMAEAAAEGGSETVRGGTWNLGQSISQLDTTRSVIRGGGDLHFGVTTVERLEVPNPYTVGVPKARGYNHINFILDVSRSMDAPAAPDFKVDATVIEREGAPEKVAVQGVEAKSLKVIPSLMARGVAYPAFKVRRSMSDPVAPGADVDPTEIKRVVEVAEEVGVTFIAEAKRLGFTVSTHAFNTSAKRGYGPGKDYEQAMYWLLMQEPDGGTSYQAGFRLALEDIARVGGQGATVFLTDAGDFSAFDPNATGPPADMVKRLLQAGPLMVMFFGTNPDDESPITIPGAAQPTYRGGRTSGGATVRDAMAYCMKHYGDNLKMAAFPDLAKDDAVAQAAKWAITL